MKDNKKRINLSLKYSKTCLKQPLKRRQQLGFQERLSPNAGQSLEHSAIVLICLKLPSVFKIIVLSVLGWPLKTGFTLERIKLMREPDSTGITFFL